MTTEKQTAIEFVEWVVSEGWQNYDGADRWIQYPESLAVYETKELFEKWQEEKKRLEEFRQKKNAIEPPDPDIGHFDYLKESDQLKSFD